MSYRFIKIFRKNKHVTKIHVLVCEGVKAWHSKTPHFCYINYFELNTLEKQQMQGDAFSEPHLSVKRQILQRDQIVINPLPELPSTRNADPPKERGLEVDHTQVNSITNCHTSWVFFSRSIYFCRYLFLTL